MSKMLQIKETALRLSYALFPEDLLIYTFRTEIIKEGSNSTHLLVKTGEENFDLNESFNRVKKTIEFENYTQPQMEFLFEQLDLRHDEFILKEWYCFNKQLRKLEGYFREPEFLHLTKDVDYMNPVALDKNKIQIELLKARASEKYKYLKEKFLSESQSKQISNHPASRESTNLNNLTIIEHFDRIRNLDLGMSDLFDFVINQTALDESKLNYLKQDLEEYIDYEKNELTAQIPQKDKQQYIFDLEAKYPGIIEQNTKIGFNGESYLDIDYFNHFYPTEFVNLFILLNLLNSELTKKSNIANTDLVTERNRLKTNLSVPQLALLFSSLNELKPNIFSVSSEAELHRFISSNFETKKSPSEGISTNKLRNLFSSPDPKDADYWITHLHTIVTNLRKIK